MKMRKKDNTKGGQAMPPPPVKRKRREQLHEHLLDGAVLVGTDLMCEMIRMIKERKLSRQEIACRIVDMMEARNAAKGGTDLRQGH
jgi:hypothetical protein